MKFAIISAGEGSRLSQEGVQLPKPLVQLNGVAMIDRLIHIFAQNGAEEVVVIINNEVPLTKVHLHELEKTSEVPLRVVVKTTPSSMHSFYELSRYLKDDRFCLTTVDTIFREEEFARFIEAFKAFDGDGMMAVTDYIDDEKPCTSVRMRPIASPGSMTVCNPTPATFPAESIACRPSRL